MYASSPSFSLSLSFSYYDQQSYRLALPLISDLLKELKRLDDKMVLTEVHLLESKVNHAIHNLPKAKAALTSARTSANSIYVPPLMQASLDMQSGVLHAEDKDYSTAYSYFFETLEGLAAAESQEAPKALKYMLLCKIMLNLNEDVKAINGGKLAVKYKGRDTDAMGTVAKAYEDRSLEGFENALKEYKEGELIFGLSHNLFLLHQIPTSTHHSHLSLTLIPSLPFLPPIASELSNDPIIRAHLSALYDTLLEQNLLRIIEPYSRVEIGHVAQKVGLPEREVEMK